MHILVLQLDHKETAELRHEFQNVDKDNSGFIEIDELRETLMKSGGNFTEEQIDSII